MCVKAGSPFSHPHNEPYGRRGFQVQRRDWQDSEPLGARLQKTGLVHFTQKTILVV